VSVVVTSQAGPLDDAQLLRGKFALGNFELILCSDGTFLLDGGAIFGVFPGRCGRSAWPPTRTTVCAWD
jgi:hypothetical protein